jgi:hypothetical protein
MCSYPKPYAFHSRRTNLFYIYVQVQAIVENGKNLDLRKALRIAADAQPIDIPEFVLEEVSFPYIGISCPSSVSSI